MQELRDMMCLITETPKGKGGIKMAVREITKDPNILKQKSEPFIFGQDEPLLQDMLDTANANKAVCVGLAAVQIGVHKRVILVRRGEKFMFMINPCIIQYGNGIYYTTEGCLSVDSPKTAKRYRAIMVSYTDEKENEHTYKIFKNYVAQIIQHEVDHLNGVLI